MKLFLLIFVVLFAGLAFAQPGPGDVFREYLWFNETGSAGQALRVGGLYDYGGDYINHTANLDLTDAIKAEIVIEKILCHAGTEGLSIEINEKGWILVPESEYITKPQKSYQHHFYPVIEIPLSDLNQGINNKFRMKVTPIFEGWPQNLIYGVHIRIYYDPARKAHPTGNITSPSSGDMLGDLVSVQANVTTNGSALREIQFIGKYEDVNYEGDGIYRQWHYHFFHGQIMHHLGTSPSATKGINWSTSWVPDQFEPVEIAARIIDNSGMTYFTESVSNLKLDRPETSVVLIKPYDIPEHWVTRTRIGLERLSLRSDLDRIQAAQMVWTSWSPDQMDGLYINATRVFEKEGPSHKYYFHRVNLSNVNVFNENENILFTAKTEGGIHGMEVQWPGIMVLLKMDISGISKTPPPAPDSLSAEFLEKGIKINWNDNADNERGFIVERKIKDGSYSVIQKLTSMQATSILDTDIEFPNKYVYRISAFNDYGTSEYKQISVSTPNNKALIEFNKQSDYVPNVNWLDNASFYFLYDYVGIHKKNGVLKTVPNRPYTSTYIGQSFSYHHSNTIGQSIYFKPASISKLNADALKLGLISNAGDELKLDSSDSSFVAVALRVTKDEKKWELKCYNKFNSTEYEIADSTLTSFFPKSTSWYKMSISWTKEGSNSIAYTMVLDDYGDGSPYVIKQQILELSGIITNASICNNDSIFAALEADDKAGIDAVDNFFIYDQSEPLVGIKDDPFSATNVTPKQFSLSQNYPNPFNPSTTINFSLPKAGIVKVEIFNVLGQKIETLVNDFHSVGTHYIHWNASSMPSGVYFYALSFNGNQHEVKKMLFVK